MMTYPNRLIPLRCGFCLDARPWCVALVSIESRLPQSYVPQIQHMFRWVILYIYTLAACFYGLYKQTDGHIGFCGYLQYLSPM
jgi:hypothetical protein